jgi:hypothetical protein
MADAPDDILGSGQNCSGANCYRLVQVLSLSVLRSLFHHLIPESCQPGHTRSRAHRGATYAIFA